MKKIRVRNATKKGYLEVGVGGCFDTAFPSSDKRRGRVIDGGVLLRHSTQDVKWEWCVHRESEVTSTS